MAAKRLPPRNATTKNNSIIYILDHETSRVLYSSADINAFLGFEPGSYTGENPLWPRLPFSESPVSNRGSVSARSAVSEPAPVEYERQARNAQGEWRWLSFRENIFKRHPDGGIAQIIGTVEDVTRRKELEETLKISEERLALAMEATEDGLWDWELATGKLSVNAQWLAMLGYTEAEFSGHISFWEPLCHPDDLPEARRRLEAIFEGSNPAFQLEHRLRHRDGSWLWVLGRAKVTRRDAKGYALRVVGTNINIHARKSAEEARQIAEQHQRKMETRLRQTVECVRLGFWDWDIPSGKTRLDAEWFKLLGYAPGELPEDQETWDNTIHPDDRERVRAILAAHLADPATVYEVDYRAFQKSGETLWVLARGSVVEWDTNGTPRRMIGTLQDIQERKAQDEAIRVSEERFRSAINAMHDGLVFQNRNAEIMVCNDRAEAILGLTADQMAGRTSLDPRWRAIYPDGADWPGDSHPAMIALQEGKAQWDVIMGIHKPDGALTWLNINADPLFREGSAEPHAVVVTFADITERRRLEEEQRLLMAEAMERADRDPLTNLYNHRTFYHRLNKQVEEARHAATETEDTTRSGRRLVHPHRFSLAVAVMDLDNFKFFNDAYGHLVGDEVLCSVADALRSCCRQEDVIARIGGDEFALLMPRINRSEADTWGRRLRQTVYNLSYQPPGDAVSIPLRLSVGIAIFPEDAGTAADVLYLADKRALWDKTAEESDGNTHSRAEQLRSVLTGEADGFSMLDALVAAVDNKDRYTRRHSEDVMRYSTLIAEGLGLPESEIASLQIAALIHDVGKIGVPNKVLRRPGALSEPEFDSIRQHPVLGGLLVGAIPELAHTLDAVKYHHERWDGTGYPAGLAGDFIPFSARILAVADAFSAMTTNRPYRKGMSHDEAASLLEQGAGTQWDAVCVAALLRALALRL